MGATQAREERRLARVRVVVVGGGGLGGGGGRERVVGLVVERGVEGVGGNVDLAGDTRVGVV